MPQILDRRRDNPRAACRANDEIQTVVREMLDYHWGNGRERAFAGSDKVRGGGDVPECVYGLLICWSIV